jgi:ATP-dependent DNA helicase RecG
LQVQVLPGAHIMKFSTSVSEISGVGPANKKKLEKLKIKTVGDLLFYFPRRYENFSQKTSVASIYNKGKYTVEGRVVKTNLDVTIGRRIAIFEVTIKDKTGEIKAVWFNQPYLKDKISEGDEIVVSGTVSFSKNGLQFSNPFYRKLNSDEDVFDILAVYSEQGKVTSSFLRSVIKKALSKINIQNKETLPLDVVKKNNLFSLSEALNEIHFPSSVKNLKKARRRFSFERIFLLQLFVLEQKIAISKKKGVSVPVDIEKVKDLVDGLPFTLTDAQKKASWQILKDLEKETPMNRLLEGDVGSGKTIVATIASLAVIKAGHQVALMAPTEVLSKQHFDEIAKLLWRFKIDIGLLTGKKDKIRSKRLKGDTFEVSRRKLQEKVEKGEVDLLVGTHTLIQDKVKFKNLALVIVDEQQRFGVEQRAKLCLKKDSLVPHLLSMTATPIPRTLALTLYGDLDLSVIDEMPEERKPIITELVSPRKRDDAYLKIKEEIKKGRQCFFICPRIEDPDKKDNNGKKSPWANLKSVEKEKEKLSTEIFPEFKVEGLHGKMKISEKEKVMKDFRNKKIDILVSTSVIEVGVDVKNASIMVIEGAEMFGLSQLHQFRGRVGRSDIQSYCFLFTSSWNEKIKKRLKALLTSKNGFELAEKDLEIRGPGDFIGKKQWGYSDFTMKALKDPVLVEQARETAKELLNEDPSLEKYSLLRKRVDLLKRKIHLE